ncbi:hypothetical protein [Nocardioides daejeonensis]|uniref:hypothetical protein n=1 Tax=Nocardioides daejeonensis TaxID=1046556 RepID=UPI000D74DD8A|nr:hypothetical protein [Nocardioides daejeonensis]
MPDQPSDDDLAEVRRLLRAARAEGPAPDDVVARLDETLATLVAERSPAEPVDELVARRAKRRRVIAGAGLVAAATVVAAGFLGQLVGSGDEADRASDDRPALSLDEQEAGQAEASTPGDAGMDKGTPLREAPAASEYAARSDKPLNRDERRAVRYTLERLTTGHTPQTDLLGSLSTVAFCPAGVADDAVVVPIQVAGSLQALLLRPLESDGSRKVEVVDCSVDPPVTTDSVTVPPSPSRK